MSATEQEDHNIKSEPKESGDEVRAEAGRLSLQVKDKLLASVLDEISEGSKVPIVYSDRLRNDRISARVKNLPIEQGLQQLLKNQDVFYFFGAEKKERENRDESLITFQSK